MFPINEQKYRIETRKRNKFKIFKSNTNRYDKSAVPYMRRILNEDWQNNMRNMQTWVEKNQNRKLVQKWNFTAKPFILICASEL